LNLINLLKYNYIIIPPPEWILRIAYFHVEGCARNLHTFFYFLKGHPFFYLYFIIGSKTRHLFFLGSRLLFHSISCFFEIQTCIRIIVDFVRCAVFSHMWRLIKIVMVRLIYNSSLTIVLFLESLYFIPSLTTISYTHFCHELSHACSSSIIVQNNT
jgi:hypothetical protein